MYFAGHRYAVEALKAAKGPKFGQNGGQKYKIVIPDANFPFGTL